MNGKRFDKLTRIMASGSTRRSVLKGLLGIGGAAAVSTVVAESADARRGSGKARPTEIPCPDQVLCGTFCCDFNQCNAFENGCCPEGTSACNTNSTGCCAVCEDGFHECGYDCCETEAQCCDGECCAPGDVCIGEELCCTPYTCADDYPGMCGEFSQRCGLENLTCGCDAGYECVDSVCCEPNFKPDEAGTCIRDQNTCIANLRPYGDLRQCNLSGATLTGSFLRGADLTGAVLTGATMHGVDLYLANLSAADLTGAVLTGSALVYVTWNNTTCPDGANSDDVGGNCCSNVNDVPISCP